MDAVVFDVTTLFGIAVKGPDPFPSSFEFHEIRFHGFNPCFLSFPLGDDADNFVGSYFGCLFEDEFDDSLPKVFQQVVGKLHG
ncbi:hypothetical protein MA16_Dca008225 [Dendrobium catenatum]|uniref:Uncharacterized protein n=1 Tax=Dendrobium catenatum TaxID=906689 RepID=A0A2I0X6I1_9ASPA|nr:hypothetical protein MA16_Dca008225 [Dendrobium catenatum]